MVVRKLTDREDDVAPVRVEIVEPALQQDAGVVADDGIDARGRVAEEDDAGQQEGNHIFAAQQRIAGSSRRSALRRGGARDVSISSSSSAACCGVRERSRAAWARSRLAAAEEPARRLGDQQAAQHKHHAGRQRNPEDAPPGLILEGEERGGIGGSGHGLDAIAVIDAHQRRGHDAQREQPLKDGRALAAARCGQALGQIERNHHADESAADALQQAAEKQRPVAVRKRDHGNAGDEGEAAEDHQRLAAHPVGQQAGKERGEDAAQQHRRHNDRELRGGQARSGFKIGQRAADDADIDAVEQAAQARNQRAERGCSAARRPNGSHPADRRNAVADHRFTFCASSSWFPIEARRRIKNSASPSLACCMSRHRRADLVYNDRLKINRSYL